MSLCFIVLATIRIYLTDLFMGVLTVPSLAPQLRQVQEGRLSLSYSLLYTQHLEDAQTHEEGKESKGQDAGEGELAMGALDYIANSKYSFTLTPCQSRRLFNTARSTSQWETNMVENYSI